MEDIERLLTQAEDLLDRSLDNEAAEVISQVIPLIPEDPDLLFRAGCAALNARMGEEAVECLEAAHELSPQDPEILTRLADAATFVGDIDLARMCVETAFGLLDDYDYDLRMTSGYLLEKQGRFEDAVTHFRQFTADYPDGADIRARLG